MTDSTLYPKDPVEGASVDQMLHLDNGTIFPTGDLILVPVSNQFDGLSMDVGNVEEAGTSPPVTGEKRCPDAQCCLGLFDVTNLAQLNRSRKEGSLFDVTLVVQGREFPVHKRVLANSSYYFSAMFNGSYSERSAEKVEIKQVPPEIFSLVLDFMYGGDIELTLEIVRDVYGVADMLCVDSLISACKSFFRCNRSGRVEELYDAAFELEIQDVCEEVAERTRLMLSSDAFPKYLEELSPSFLCAVLKDRGSTRRLRDEALILNNFIQWAFLKHQEMMSGPVLEVLSFVRLEYVTPTDFRNVMDVIYRRKNHACTDSLIQFEKNLEAAYQVSTQKAIPLDFQLVLACFYKTTRIYVYTCEMWKWIKYDCRLRLLYKTWILGLRHKTSVLNDNQLYMFASRGGGRKYDLVKFDRI